MLKDELALTNTRMMDAPKSEFGKLQGRAKVLTEFLALTLKPSATM